MQFPYLTAIWITPVIGALIILAMPATSKMDPDVEGDRIKRLDLTVKIIAAIVTLISLVLSAIVYLGVNNAYGAGLGSATDVVFFFEEGPLGWVQGLTAGSLAIGYHVGVDGISAPMVYLTGLATFCGVLISWDVTDRPREFFAWFLLLAAGVYGVFVALDLFLLFFFYELAIFPMYLLIAAWGWKQLREYAAMKLTLYILVGSIVALVGVIAMYFLMVDAGVTASFDIYDMIAARDAGVFDAPVNLPFGLSDGLAEPITFAKIWFPFIFIGFVILAGTFPFHNWSPDGHVAAPTAVSMVHAGVLMKIGAYSALRVAVFLLPEGAQVHLPWIVVLTLINVVYGASIAMVQRDFKYVIGFSSVSHMGLVVMGIASMNILGFTGAGLQMFSHGAMTALFFSCVGMVYHQAHTRDIPSLGGFWQKMPLVALAFTIGGLVSMGMPGFSGFVAEFPIFMGMFRAANEIAPYYGIIAVIAVLGIILTGAYVLRVTGRVFFGEFDEEKWGGLIHDVTILDKVALGILAANLLVLGLFPVVMQPMVEAGMLPIATLLGGA